MRLLPYHLRPRPQKHPAVLLLACLLLHAPLAAIAAEAGPAAPLSPLDEGLLQKVERIPAMVADGAITKEDIPNPHWRPDGCTACHNRTPSPEAQHLRNSDALSICKDCHDSVTEQTHIHAVGMVPPRSFFERMPADFKGSLTAHGGRINCLTCHDILLQCKEDTFYQQQANGEFLRDAPYNTRTGICYQCHDRTKYQPLNPHDQISAKGVLLTDKCLICHLEVPKELPNGEIVGAELYRDSGLAEICINCHRKIPHPSGNLSFIKGGEPNHLVKPPAKIRQQMVKMTNEKNVYLPLEPATGQIYCATCHNPHERGVIKNKEHAMGADSENRLRIVPLCQNCHDI